MHAFKILIVLEDFIGFSVILLTKKIMKTLYITKWKEKKPCPLFIIHHNSVACAVAPSVNPLQNRENSTCEHCFAMYVSIFQTAKYERKSCLN